MALYLTIKETADYLSISEVQVKSLIQQKKIRALFDGEEHLIYKEQFSTHLKQIQKYKQLVDELLSEPIPEDIDIKDED